MPVVNPDKLVQLQRRPEEIRNICILAHVDHGKTSFSDSLIATNGIISPKMVGKVRYLDSRPDEQIRGITMESSAISLYFSMTRRPDPDSAPELKEYLVNLIDSPGHIDFSSEVSTASRLCDGAVVLVDAVEGVCSQTVTVLRQTWIEHLKPLLVINKMDRLITELKMSPTEAYAHLNRLVEQVNAVIGSFFQGERMEDDLQWREKVEAKVNAREEERSSRRDAEAVNGGSVYNQAQFEEKDDEHLYFSPEKNNVIFSSAIDGWAFTIRQFAALYEKKLGIKRSILETVLWGDYYLDPKTKRVLGQKHLKGRALKTMFVQLVLEPLWAVYTATIGGDNGKGDPVLLEKITKSLSIKLAPHTLRSRDPRVVLMAVFSAWLPLSTAVLVSVIEYLPSPPVAQADRLPALIDSSPGSSAVDPAVRDAMVNFKTSKDDPVVAYVSKMVAIPESELPQHKHRQGNMLTADEAREMARRKRAEIARAQAAAEQETSGSDVHAITSALSGTAISEDESNNSVMQQKEDPEHLIGFARLYSGTLSVGDSIYVLPPKFNPAHPHRKPEPQQVTITALYLLMGRNLEPLTSVPAGVVCAIAGLENHILKNGTLCSQVEGAINLAGVNVSSPPIVRVALEPVWPGDLDKMITGLKLLEQSDPCAQYEVLESGEHVILTAGELHLERCLKDLRERFARCEIQAGEPIVPYRESITSALDMAPPKNKNLPRGTVVALTSSRQVEVKIRVRPLPTTVTEFLTKHAGSIKKLYAERKAEEENENKSREELEIETEEEKAGEGETTEIVVLSMTEFKKQLKAAFEEDKDKEDWKGVVEKIAAFGPRRVGENILVDETPEGVLPKFLRESSDFSPNGSTEPQCDRLDPSSFSDKFLNAFQLATSQGPLCKEPLRGVSVHLQSLTFPTTMAIASAESPDQPCPSVPVSPPHRSDLPRLTGEILRTTQTAIHAGISDWSPRLHLAMYACEILTPTTTLGRVYDVLNRRHGSVLSESLKEGTPFFSILSLLPATFSWGFAEELRKRTSGSAGVSMRFSGWECLDEDPDWKPRSEEELEDFGEKGDRELLAKKLVDQVRERKGLRVEGRKLVVDAEKQKTLKR